MLVSFDGFSTISKPPLDVWFLAGSLDPAGPMSLDSLAKLGGIDLPTAPPQKWTFMMNSLTTGSVMWSQVLPTGVYKDFVRGLINSVNQTMDRLPRDYYKEVWGPCNLFLTGLKAARVDPILFKEIVQAVDRDSGALETFRPGPGGFLPPVVYDRFATRTGRLTVESGPHILTLKKGYRHILKSNFPNGKICSLDFGALEARVILYETGFSPSGSDLYTQISNELFTGSIERDVVKTAVISELYGSSRFAQGTRLGMAGRKLDGFIEAVRTYFGTPALRKRLKEEFKSSGRIKNRFGRPLEIDDPQDHLFINTYAQSTGVDVSLLGFKKIVDDLGADGIRPLFVLHDALILDVREDRLQDVEGIASVAVPGYAQQFPLKFEYVSKG
jgi:hypothetical protein